MNTQPKGIQTARSTSPWDRDDLGWLGSFHGFVGLIGFLWSLPATVLRLLTMTAAAMTPSLRFYRRVGFVFVFYAKPDSLLEKLMCRMEANAAGCVIIMHKDLLESPGHIGACLRVCWQQFTLGPVWLLLKPLLHILHYTLETSPYTILACDTRDWAEEYARYATSEDGTNSTIEPVVVSPPSPGSSTDEEDERPASIGVICDSLKALEEGLKEGLLASMGDDTPEYSWLYGCVVQFRQLVSMECFTVWGVVDPVEIQPGLVEPVKYAGSGGILMVSEIERLCTICEDQVAAAIQSSKTAHKGCYLTTMSKVYGYLHVLLRRIDYP